MSWRLAFGLLGDIFAMLEAEERILSVWFCPSGWALIVCGVPFLESTYDEDSASGSLERVNIDESTGPFRVKFIKPSSVHSDT